MKGLGKFVSWQFLLLGVFIALRASLHQRGHVDFWGMLFIMMLPNVVFTIIRIRNRRHALSAVEKP